MVNRLKPLNLFDFTGGVNLRPETFQLRANELPEMLNMEVDPRGGINTRRGWSAFGPAVTAGTWNPRSAYSHVTAAGDQFWLVANQAQVLSRVGAGAWVNVGDATANAVPHLADFASWDDLVYVVRGTGSSLYWNGTTATVLTPSGAANWQNDYTAPGATDTFPVARIVDQSHGYMFAAGTREDGVDHPNRIRWSHPNNPRRWAFDDYVDISEGGQRITAIAGFSDRMLVFKPDSLWAFFGYDAETWEVANISRTVGAHSAQVVCRNEAAVFFLSWPMGVFGYTDQGVTELSVPIRTVFQDHKMDEDSIDNSWLGWVGRRLWCSLPYDDVPPPPTDAATVFVFDPALSDPGSWMLFRGGSGCVLGPYIERADTSSNDPLTAFNRQYPYLTHVETTNDEAYDECEPGERYAFQAEFRTPWIDAGAPTWRKSWRRPDFLLRGLTFDTVVNVQVFHDYDAFNAERSFLVRYTPDNYPSKYTATGQVEDGGFMWGDGTLYGGSEQTTSVERGKTMGRAGTVQLKCVGDPGVVWGVNGIIFKFVLRRFR